MNDEQKGGALQSDGGAGASHSGDSTTQSQTKTETQPKTVSWENHQSAMTDLHKFKKLSADLQAKIGDLESQKLREKEDFKALAEKAEADAKKWKADYEKLNGYLVNTQKLQEVTKHAVASGIRPEAMKDLELIPDFKGVDLDITAKGHFVVSGAKDFVEALKNERPHWFSKVEPPRVNGAGGGTSVTGKSLTPQDVLKAERDYKSNRISKDEYKKIYSDYVVQSKSA
jgi:hypothetical protein